MATEVVDPQKNMSILRLECPIPLVKPLLEEDTCHPCLGVVAITKSQLCTCLAFECLWFGQFPDNQGWENI